MIQLRARPAVKRVNRGIRVPPPVRTILRTSPVIARQIQAGADPIVRKTKQPKSTQVTPPRRITRHRPLAVAAKHIPQIAQARRAVRGQRGPQVRYVSAEMSPQDRKSIAAIKNTGNGRVLIIIGNGPSILEADLERLKHPQIDVMSINKPDPRVWPSKFWLFCDHTQFKRHHDLWASFRGTIFNTTALKQRRKNAIKIRNLGGSGFSKDLINGFHLGRSSCFAAMQVAYWMGYDKVYLFGVDMRSVKVNGQVMTHFYGVNPDVQPKNREGRFDHEAKHYDRAADDLQKDERKRFVFCSSYLKYGFAEKFSKLDHKKAVQKILDSLGDPDEQEN